MLWNQEVDEFGLLGGHVDVAHQGEGVVLVDWHDSLQEETSCSGQEEEQEDEEEEEPEEEEQEEEEN